MSLFGSKKNRAARAANLKTSALSNRLKEAMQDQGVLLRLFLCLIAIMLTVVAVEGWKTPFHFRLGDSPNHGVIAKVPFQRVNRFESERAKSRNEENTPLVFSHDPSVLSKIPDLLRDRLEELAKVESADDISAELRSEFGWPTPEQQIPQSSDSAIKWIESFLQLQNTIVNKEGIDREKLDRLIDDLQQLLATQIQNGLIDSNDLDQLQIGLGDTISVIFSDKQSDRKDVPIRSVRIEELFSDNGSLSQENWRPFISLLNVEEQLTQWLKSQLRPTLIYDSATTLQEKLTARESTELVFDSFERGTILVSPGETINEDSLAILQAEYEEAERLIEPTQRVARVVIVFLLISVLAILNGFYLVRNHPKLACSGSHLSVYLLAMALAVALGRFLSYDPWQAEVIPLLAIVLVISIAYNQVLAIVTAFTLTLLFGTSTVADLGQFVVLMSVSATAIVTMSHVPSRSKIIKVGFWSGLTYAAVTWGVGITEAPSLNEIWSDNPLLIESLRGALCCLIAGYLVAGSLPFIESMFGVVTDISLLELGDVSHPLLQELVRRAPGTYNHSISVATIGEAAADQIGANGLLVRVSAYFHDIGKMLRPQYFVENMSINAESRHEQLNPAMSTLIIIGHVKDGVELAKQHNLPERLIDFIEQHHGTTLVEYFYHEASKSADQEPEPTDVDESAFRYPGPKPQSREAGVMMLADAVESASRTLSDPTPKRIETLVHEITLKRLLDGQFDESSLTFCEIHTVEESLTKSLIAIYHGRIKYPEQKTA